MNLIRKICNALDLFTEGIGFLVSWLLIVMVCLAFLIVVFRYFLQLGSIALQESITYFHALVFLLGSSYAMKYDAHVRVDIFYRNFTARKKALINTIGILILLFPTLFFFFFLSWDYVVLSWSIKEGSAEAGGIPLVYLLKTLILVQVVLLALQAMTQLYNCLTELFPKLLMQQRPN